MARSTTKYKVSAGRYTAASDARQGDRQLLSLVVERGMGTSGGRCVVVLGGTGHAPVAAGDDVKVQLDAGRGMLTVFTGKAYGVNQR